MLSGLIGKKLGMTQLTDASGRVRAVTVIQLGPCTVTQIKSEATDGYQAVQVTLGQPVSVGDVFKVGDPVDVQGVSKGRGFAGVIKRHHFAGFPGSHGTQEYFRHGGSIGNRSYPGRVRKGMRMAGQLGNRTAAVLNQNVLEVLPDDNAIVVSGAAPGADGGIVIVSHSAKQRAREKMVAAGG